MASTLALCLQWKNKPGEKPGHPLHNARGPADSPKQLYCNYYCISFITAITCLRDTSGFESHRVYLMASRSAAVHYYIAYIRYTYILYTLLFLSFHSEKPSHPAFFAFFPSLELFFPSLKSCDNDLPWKQTTPIDCC